MRGADASAGTIKSGGATRRAAKMVVLDVDHPDIEDFIETKVKEEEKIRALRDAGFDMDLGGDDITSVQYQNANNSVRVNDEFMKAVENGGEVRPARPDDRRRHRGGRRQVALPQDGRGRLGLRRPRHPVRRHHQPLAHLPGVRPDHRVQPVQRVHAPGQLVLQPRLAQPDEVPEGRRQGHQSFDAERFAKVVELVITAMDISICFADFPTEKIGETTRAFRQLGIGYANLGALLMATGHAYDSDGGRALAGAITSLMTGTSYKRSAELAAVVGPYDGYARNADAAQARHEAARRRQRRRPTAWTTWTRRSGPRPPRPGRTSSASARRTVSATRRPPSSPRPAPSVSMMDCDTTGVEPDLALVKFKKLVGGGSMQIVNDTVPQRPAPPGLPGGADRGDRRPHRRARQRRSTPPA